MVQNGPDWSIRCTDCTRAEEGNNVIFPGDDGYPPAGIQLIDSSWVVLMDWNSVETQSGKRSFNGVNFRYEDITVQNSRSVTSILQYLITGEARRITVQDTRIETP